MLELEARNGTIFSDRCLNLFNYDYKCIFLTSLRMHPETDVNCRDIFCFCINNDDLGSVIAHCSHCKNGIQFHGCTNCPVILLIFLYGCYFLIET